MRRSHASRSDLSTAVLAVALVLGCSRPASSERAELRVASGLVLGDELLWRFGEPARGRTVAVSSLADDPRYSTVAGVWPESVVRLGRDPEQLVATRADLVLLSTFTDPGYRQAASGSARVLEFRDFTGFTGLLQAVDQLGAALGEPERAREIAAEITADLDALRASTPVGKRPTCVAWSYGHVPAASTTFTAAAEIAGCDNPAAGAGLSGHARVDAEQIVAWDPDYVVLECEGVDDCASGKQAFVGLPGFEKMRAVRAGALIMVPPPLLSTTGPALVDLVRVIRAGLGSGSG